MGIFRTEILWFIIFIGTGFSKICHVTVYFSSWKKGTHNEWQKMPDLIGYFCTYLEMMYRSSGTERPVWFWRQLTFWRTLIKTVVTGHYALILRILHPEFFFATFELCHFSMLGFTFYNVFSSGNIYTCNSNSFFWIGNWKVPPLGFIFWKSILS